MCQRTKEIIKAAYALKLAHGNFHRAARYLDINPAHLYNAFKRAKPSPTLERAMVRAGCLEPKPTRVRLAIDCSADTRRQYRQLCARANMSAEDMLLQLMQQHNQD